MPATFVVGEQLAKKLNEVFVNYDEIKSEQETLNKYNNWWNSLSEQRKNELRKQYRTGKL